VASLSGELFAITEKTRLGGSFQRLPTTFPFRNLSGDTAYGQVDIPLHSHSNLRAKADRQNDLLNLSRIVRSEMHTQRFDISALACSIAADLQESQPERQVEFRIEHRLEAVADPGLLQNVLENLLGNAWKFTSKRASACIEFGQVHLNGTSAYFVRDDGAGFDQAYSQRLFGAFQRLHTETEFPGTGVGLATVQRIVHRHGGRIWVESAVDQGATFYFTLAESAS
jgi:light-regulated signal transduction histidine kinase (bacteriophytochrome)